MQVVTVVYRTMTKNVVIPSVTTAGDTSLSDATALLSCETSLCLPLLSLLLW